MSSEYSVDYIRAMAETLRFGDTDGDQDNEAADMLNAFANRIEADDRAVPANADDAFNTFRLAYYGSNKSLAPELESFRRAYHATIAQNAELVEKYKWQVRDTCTRAEKAEKRLKALEQAMSEARKRGTHNHSLLNNLESRADEIMRGEG